MVINYRAEEIPLRHLIQACQEQGHPEAKFVKADNNSDLRSVLAHEVKTYLTRFSIGVVCWLPIMVLAWIVPYTNPHFLTSLNLYRGCTLYVMLMFIFATIIQIGLGQSFYIGAYKSVRAGSANMDVLVVLGTTAAWLYGIILIFIGHN